MTAYEMRISDWSSDVCSSGLDATLRHSFSLNINISSVLSQRFLEFDARLDKTRRNTIVIELQKVDVFADLARYLFTRDFLLDRGYRICLDGLTALSLPFIDRQKLGFDLIKLHWTPQLRQQIEGKRSEEHTSELQSLMRISYAVFCLKK